MSWSNTVVKSSLTIALALSIVAHAEKSHQQKWEESLGKQMSVKCYVEYLGGGNDIRFVIGGFKKPNEAKAMLNKLKVKNSNEKKIAKIKECTEVKDDFKSAQANHLFSQTAR